MALGYVRPARESDAARIAEIQLATWRTAYTKIVPDTVLASFDEEWLAEHWHEACAHPPSPAHQVFIAVEQGETDRANIKTVGFAAIGPDTEDDAARAGLVTELLVEPRFGRRGHGSRLLSAMVAHWRAHQISVAHAWPFTRDSASLNFYKTAGWDADGNRRTLDMDGRQVPQLRLHTDLTEAAE